MKPVLQLFSLMIILGAAGELAAGAGESPESRPSLEKALAACQDLKSDDVLLRTSFYQGRTSEAVIRDMKLGLICRNQSAENLFWAVGRQVYGMSRAEHLKIRAKLWDTGQTKVTLTLPSRSKAGTQVACYATLSKEAEEFKTSEIYCWTVFSVNDGVNYKIQEELTSFYTRPLYQAFRTCLRSASLKIDGENYYLACQGSEAESLLSTFRDGTNARGDRYSLTEEEIRNQVLAQGSASAVYSRSDKAEKVIFGEKLGFFGGSVKLSDNCQCEKILKGSEAGKVSCRLYFGSLFDLSSEGRQ